MKKVRNQKNEASGKKGWAAWVFFTLFFAGMAVFMYIVFFTNTMARSQGVETFPLTQAAKRFDPYAELTEVRRRVGPGAHLGSIMARCVRSDGTMDLTADYSPAPQAVYKFIMPALKPPKDMPPIGAGRKPDDIWVQEVEVKCYRPGQVHFVTRMSGGSTTKFSYHNEGMNIDRDSPTMGRLYADIGDPKASCAAMWKMATDKGAPADAVAFIGFDSTGYQLHISGVKAGVTLDPAGHEAVNVPTSLDHLRELRHRSTGKG